MVTISLIIAFVTLGFAHKSISTQLAPELAAYVAAGGSLDDLCGGDQLPGHAASVSCEACRIADSFAIFQDCKLSASAEQVRVRTWRFVAKRLLETQDLDPARLTRAPPYA